MEYSRVSCVAAEPNRYSRGVPASTGYRIHIRPFPIVLLFLLTFVLAVLLPEVAAASEAKPSAELKIVLVQRQGWDQPLTLHVKASGPIPVETTATLVDAEGVSASDVTVLKEGEPNLTAHYAGQATHDWYLKLSKPPVAGKMISGTIEGTQSKLVLTLGTRHPFFWLPFLVTLGALVAGLAITALTGAGLLEEWANSAMRRWIIWSNGQKNRRIGDLDDWVKKEHRRRSAKTLRGLVADVFGSGWQQNDEAKQSLATLLKETQPRLEKYPLWTKADNVVTAAPLIGDFIAGGKPRETFPADEQKAILKRMTCVDESLTRAEGDIGTHGNDVGLNQFLNSVRRALATAENTAALAEAEQRAGKLREAIDKYISGGAGEDDYRVGVGAEEPVAEGQLLPDGAPVRVWITAISSTFAPLVGAGLAAWSTILVLMTAAIGTLALKYYFSNPIFGSPRDYLELAFASFAASAATGVVGVLFIWRREPV
jgi:hypothetical protein